MYYNLLIRYHEHQNSYIDICRCYRSIYEARISCCIHSPWRINLSIACLCAACYVSKSYCGLGDSSWSRCYQTFIVDHLLIIR